MTNEANTERKSSRKRKSPWNSLEITKLISAVLTPIAIVWFGWSLNEQSREVTLENNQASAQRAEQNRKKVEIINRRADLWKEISSPLNDIYVYFLYVGHWKDLSEPDVLNRKRHLDKIIYSNRPFFSDEFFNAYQHLIAAAFEPYGGWGVDAKLRTRNIRPQDRAIDDNRFTGEDEGAQVHAAYFHLLEIVAAELDLELRSPSPAPHTPAYPSDIVVNN